MPRFNLRTFHLNHNRFIGEVFWVILAQILMLLGGLVTIKLLSNLLSKPQFAIYALLFSTASLLVSFLYIPLGQINVRFLVLARENGFIGKFRQEQHSLLLGISGLCIVLLLPATWWLSHYTGHALTTFIALLILTLAMGTQTAQQFNLMAFRLRKEGSLVQLIGALSRPAGVAIFLWIAGFSALPAIGGLACGLIILGLSQAYYLQNPWHEAIKAEKSAPLSSRSSPQNHAPKDNGEREKNGESGESGENDKTGLRTYLAYGGVYALGGLVTIIVANADRWLLSVFGTLEQVAIYAALMQISVTAAAFNFAIANRLASPIFFKTKNQPLAVQNRQFRLLLAGWGLMAGTVTGFVILFHYPLVKLLTNASFASHSWLLPWMVTAFFLERTAQIFEMKGSMLLQTKIYIIPRILIIFIVPLFEYLALRWGGFDALVIGLMAATGLSLVSIMAVNYFKL